MKTRFLLHLTILFYLTERYYKEKWEQTPEIQKDFPDSLGLAWDSFMQCGVSEVGPKNKKIKPLSYVLLLKAGWQEL